MIEIYPKEKTNTQDDMLFLGNLISWLLHELKAQYITGQDTSNVFPGGYIIVYDEELQRVDALMFCQGETQNKILERLQQPPPAYKDKYIACIPSKEPEPVKEETEMEDGELNVEDEGERHKHRKVAHVNGMEDLDET